MSEFELYVDRHMTAPEEGASIDGAKDHFEREFRRLKIEACRVHCDVAEEELRDSGDAERFEADAPRFHAALLLTTYFHRALGPDFDAHSVAHWKIPTEAMRSKYERLNPDGLALLVKCLKEGRKLLSTTRNRWAVLTVPFFTRAQVSALMSLEARIDVASEIVEAFFPGEASRALGAVKMRHFLPDDLWNGPEMKKERMVLDQIYRWDSYVVTNGVVRSVYLHRMQKIPADVVEGLGLDALVEPFPPPLRGEILGRLVAQIALLPEQEYQEFGPALSQARWALVFPSGHHRVQD